MTALLLASMVASAPCYAEPEIVHCYCETPGTQSMMNIPPRLQWTANYGYCGEVSLISAGLYFGQYISQYDIRAAASKGQPQSKSGSQLLIGVNDAYTAAQLHLQAVEWDTDDEQNTDDFLAWIKQHVVKGHPVAAGIYINHYLFNGDADPNAGDPDYDHIVPVMGISTNHSLSDGNYYDDDGIYFSDNGLWEASGKRPYNFSYIYEAFQASRQQANAKNGPLYSITNDASNYGIAITGIADLKGETFPVRVDTDLNYEHPDIAEGSDDRPAPMPLTLTITVSGLTPNTPYTLYRYNTLESVPDSDFNDHPSYQQWPVEIASGTSYVMTQQISSDEIAVYRAVKTSP